MFYTYIYMHMGEYGHLVKSLMYESYSLFRSSTQVTTFLTYLSFHGVATQILKKKKQIHFLISTSHLKGSILNHHLLKLNIYWKSLHIRVRQLSLVLFL